MAFEQKSKRRPWTEEEKKETLKSCASRCACCGTKLTMRTLTMEHVIPISKGGGNIPENLVVLCKSCNSRKSNNFFWPLGYYMALGNKSKLIAIDKYTKEWVKENITPEYIEQYPLVAEGVSAFLKTKDMEYKIKNGAYIPSLITDIQEVNEENCNTVLREHGLSKRDVYNSIHHRDKPFSLIAATKRSTGECYALFTLQLFREETRYDLKISEVFSSSDRAAICVIRTLILTFVDLWLQYGIDIVIVRLKNESSIKSLYEFTFNNNIGFPVRFMVNNTDQFDYPGKDESVYGTNQILLKFCTGLENAMYDAKKQMSNK